MEVDEKVETLREATREANMALKDIHKAVKDTSALLDRMAEVKADLLIVADSVFQDRLEEQVAKHLAAYTETMEANIDRATQAVYDRFDTLGRVLLGKGTTLDIDRVVATAVQDDALPVIQRP